MDNTLRSIMHSCQQISRLLLAAGTCGPRAPTTPKAVFMHIGTGHPLQTDELQKLGPGLQTPTLAGSQECEGSAYSSK